MSEQRHIIKRQVLELQVGRADEARWLQAALGRIYRQRIVPLIDQYCTELSAPDVVHRIERLELDVGSLDVQRLEADFVAKVREQLKLLLARYIHAEDSPRAPGVSGAKAIAQLELFTLFAQTGTIPWWADGTTPHLLADSLRYLIEQTPVPLRGVMRTLGQEPVALRRLIHHYDDDHLTALLDVLVPSLQASRSRDVSTMISVLSATQTLASRGAANLRRGSWKPLLQIASAAGSQHMAAARFYRDSFRRIAVELGVSYRVLMADVQNVVQAGQASLRPPLKALFVALSQTSSQTEPTRVQPGADAIDWSLTETQAADEMTHQSPVADGLSIGQTDQMPSLHDVSDTAVHSEVARPISRGEPLQPGLAETQADDAMPPEAQPPAADSPTAQTDQMANWLGESDTAGRSPIEMDAGAVDLRFSDAEALYIGNAGLVILWPFLSPFFEHLGILDANRQFQDTVVQQRAAVLLHYLATEESSGPEYLMPLNKLLCGIELGAVLEADSPVSEAEAEVCVNLLTAVIAQAPILRNMSVQGFRGTFLLRQGKLSARDGVWLLQVERETYDIVLDRFPWSLEWVKLPWMDTLLRVEW